VGKCDSKVNDFILSLPENFLQVPVTTESPHALSNKFAYFACPRRCHIFLAGFKLWT